MNYFNNQLLIHLRSPSIYMFGFGLTIATYCGRKLLTKYQSYYNKYKTNCIEQKNICTHHKKINIDNTLYFILHFLFNMFCVYNCWNSVYSLVNKPTLLIKVPNTMAIYTFLFHLYHVILCGNKISSDELLHHLWVFIICPLMTLNYINLSDMGMFFMTGLPGGITYLLLSLKNMDFITDITEKRISKHLNMWIRAPGCVLTSYFIYLNYVNNSFGNLGAFKKLGVFLCMFGTFVNGMYFAGTIIESHGVTKYKEKISKDNKLYNEKT